MSQPFYLSGEDCEIVAIIDDLDNDSVLDVLAVVRDDDTLGLGTFSVWMREAGLWLKVPDVEEAMFNEELSIRSLSADARLAASIPRVLDQVDAKTMRTRRVTSELHTPPTSLNVDDRKTRERIARLAGSGSAHLAWEIFESRLATFLRDMVADGNHLVITFDVGGYSPGHHSSPYVQIAGFGGMLRAEIAGTQHLPHGRKLLELAAKRLDRGGWWMDTDVGNLALERPGSEAAAVAAELIQVLRMGFNVDDASRATVDAWGPAVSAERVELLTQLYLQPEIASPASVPNALKSDHGVTEPTPGIRNVLADSGLLVPPLGSTKIEDVKTFGPWHWGTRELSPKQMHMFEVTSIVTAILDDGPLFAVSHTGHGINSYGLNAVTTGGPFAAFIQHGFGGAYIDPLQGRLRINEAYTYLHVLLEAAELPGTKNPKWLLLYSEFRGTCGIVELDEVRAGKPWQESFTPFPDFKSAIRGAVALVSDEKFIGSAAPIDWGSDAQGDESGAD